MSDNINKGVEETKNNNHLGEYQTASSIQTPEEITAELTQILDNMFDPKNLVTNKYLVQRAKTDTTFEIPILYIYEEYTIKAKTENKELIDKALKQTQNITLIIKNDKLEAVKPKKNDTKTKITLNDIEVSKEQAVTDYLTGLGYTQEEVLWKFLPSFNKFEISCRDEDVANDLTQKLTSTPPFKDSKLIFSLDLLNLYISALDFSKRKAKKPNPNYQGQPRSYYPNPYQQYSQMYYPNSMNYGGYPQYYKSSPNYQMQGMGQDQNQGGYVKKPYKKSYNNYGNGNGNYNGGYNNNRGGRGKYTKKADSPNVNLNEAEFPPLNEDNQQEK
jgi:hypothetical protein